MASEWVRCTNARGKSIRVNLARAVAIGPSPEIAGARVYFAMEPDDWVDVREAPADVLKAKRG